MEYLKKIILILVMNFIWMPTVLAKPEKIEIKYNVNDPEGRCGNPAKNNCAEVATVTYSSKTVTYYMQKQEDAEGLIIDGSCRSHALMSVINAIKDTKYSTLDMQNLLKKYAPYDGRLMASNINEALEYFDVEATVYHSDTSKAKTISLINNAFKNDLPAILFVHSNCSDLASSNHALVLLGTDDDGNVVFIDSSTRYPNAKKRTISQLVNGCFVGKSVGDNYFTLVAFGDEQELSGGLTSDPYDYDFIEQPSTSDDFTCETIFLKANGEETDLKKILNDIFTLIQILAPIIAIIFTIIDYYKVLTKLGDTKKANLRTIKRIVVATFVVFLPLILELLFHIFGLYDLSTCGIGE